MAAGVSSSGSLASGGVRFDHRGRGLFGIGKQVAVDGHIAEAPSSGVGIVQYGGFQKLLVGRIEHRFGLQQRQQFLRRDLFGRLVGGFFQNRVLDDLLGDHLLQFQPVKLEDGDHLHQARGQNLLLRDL